MQSTASTCTRSAQRHRFRSAAAAVTPSAVGAMLLRRCPSHLSVSSDDVDADIAGMLADLSRLCAQIYGRWRIGAQLLEAIVQCPTASPTQPQPTDRSRRHRRGCAGTGLTPPTSAPALGSPRPSSAPALGSPRPSSAPALGSPQLRCRAIPQVEDGAYAQRQLMMRDRAKRSPALTCIKKARQPRTLKPLKP